MNMGINNENRLIKKRQDGRQDGRQKWLKPKRAMESAPQTEAAN
jgi:hypothetical protein